MQPEPRENSPALESRRTLLLRRLAAWRLWRAEVRYALVLAAFAVLTLYARAYAYFAWDKTIALRLQSLHAPGLEPFMYAVSYIGYSWVPYALTAVTVGVFLSLRKRSEAYGLLLSAAGSGLLNRSIKMFIARPRPTASDVSIVRLHAGQSFPSGHVTFYVCYFGFLFFVAYALLPPRTFARRLALTLTALMIPLVGLSRVYLGAHWPSDTIGAYFLGGLWLAFSLHWYRRWKDRSTFHPEVAAKARDDD